MSSPARAILCEGGLLIYNWICSFASFPEVTTTTTTTTAQTLTYKDGESDDTNEISRLEAVVGSHERRDDSNGKTRRVERDPTCYLVDDTSYYHCECQFAQY